MQTTCRLVRPVAKGFALTITLVFLGVVLMIFASILYWSSSNAKVTIRNNQYNMSQAAAEGAVEMVIGRIDRDFISQTISNSSAYTTLPANIDQSTWPVKYVFSDANGVTNQISVITNTPIMTSLNSQYTGLYGLMQPYDVIATATPINQPQMVPATIHETLQFAAIPIFQFAIFYNLNLEMNAGAAESITGPVFCNASIWEGSSMITFSSSVSAAGTNNMTKTDPFDTSAPGGNGGSPPTFLLSTPSQPVDKAHALVMPIGTNNDPNAIAGLLQLPPPDYPMGTAAAYSTAGKLYPANGADLVISNAWNGTNFAWSSTNLGSFKPSGTNITIWYQDSGLTPLLPDFYILKTPAFTGGPTITNFVYPPGSGQTNRCATNVQYAGWSFLTNVVFYDWREGWNGGAGPPKAVQALQIDIAKYGSWLTNAMTNILGGYLGAGSFDAQKVNSTGHHIDSMYVYNSVPLTTNTLPAVRLVNGQQLPNPGNARNGFTVATPFPVYVSGNYNVQTNGGSPVLGSTNTSSTYPAAIMGDAVTILSVLWNDSNSFTQKPKADDTTVNAAMLEGIVESVPGGDYSGGADNFLRLLEDWNNQTLTYNGSIVVLFDSNYATNSWKQIKHYYDKPSRNWSFDLNFTQQPLLPPLTPSIKAMVRGQWMAQ